MQLTLTLTVFFVLLVIPPLAEKLISQTVTSRALLGSIALAVAVLEQELSSSPSMMSHEVRETRVQIKRRLKSAHETLVEAQILHSAAVVRAIAKDRK